MTRLLPNVRRATTTALAAALLLRSDAAGAAGCEVMDCGSNTPVMFATPIVGLSLAGNLGSTRTEQVVLEPELSRVRPRPPGSGDDCAKGAVLSIERHADQRDLRGLAVGGQLIGVAGSQTCRGNALIGMAFWISVPCGRLAPKPCVAGQRRRAQIRIDSLGTVHDWVLPRGSSPALVTYRLVWNKLPDGASAGGAGFAGLTEQSSICPTRTKWMEDWQQPRKPYDRITQIWTDATDHLLVVQGEIYDQEAAVDRSGAEWFSLACAGTVVAKLRLLGYDPMDPQVSSAERQATLKMISARYHGATAYTRPGTPLVWRHRDAAREFDGEPDAGRWRTSLVEAYWGPAGALCVSHRRTWRRIRALRSVADYAKVLAPDATGPSHPAPALRTCLGEESGPHCAEIIAAAEERELTRLHAEGVPECPTTPPAHWFWTTYPVDHIRHPQ